MKALIPSLVFMLVLTASCGDKQHHELLVEAESFREKGGWLVDPQFTEQMGSAYLLAHGLGNPVENASTIVTIPASGKYHVWVRTRNWAKGNWEAPGRFKLLINGNEFESILGTEEEIWHWQYAGKVTLKDPAMKIELRDLTGFEGRCDAIYLSTKKAAPPTENDELAVWRRKLHDEADAPEKTAEFDLVITGGGIAGCAAAIAAAEQGLLVALVHDRPVYSVNIDKLFMAGRCFSCSHVGLRGPRVMHTTGQMGVAIGYAASLCKKYNTLPRGIYENHIGELRKLIGIE